MKQQTCRDLSLRYGRLVYQLENSWDEIKSKLDGSDDDTAGILEQVASSGMSVDTATKFFIATEMVK